MNELHTPGITRLATHSIQGREQLLVGMKEGYTDKPQYLKQLKTEWSKHHELDHPAIVKYVDQRDVEGFGPAIVMEWEPAQSLDEYLKEDHSYEEKKQIVRQVATALSYLHQQQVVHGAVSPATIFVTRQGQRAKLLLFHPRFADRLYAPQQLLKYLAPEAKDGTVTLDARTDIYSLGILIRELGLADSYPDVVKEATQTGRAMRYADVDAFLDAFEGHRISRRIKSNSQSTATQPPKRMAIVIATIVGLMLVGGIVYWNMQSSSDGGADPQPQTAQQAEAKPSDDNQTATAQQPPQRAPQRASQRQQYSGEYIFLNDLVPRMQSDLDKIYAKGLPKDKTKHEVAVYYRGLRKAIRPKSEEQYAMFDKEFAQYVNIKNGQVN